MLVERQEWAQAMKDLAGQPRTTRPPFQDSHGQQNEVTYTWYKGTLQTAASLQALDGQVNGNTPQANHKPNIQGQQLPRVEVLSLNAGALSEPLFQELQAWLATPEATKFNIVTLQETRWKESGDFTSGNWNIIGMGKVDGDKCAGLMMFVNKRSASQHEIQHREIIKGSIQHVRIHRGSNVNI